MRWGSSSDTSCGQPRPQLSAQSVLNPAHQGRGYLHVLRHGEMEVTHPDNTGGLRRVHLDKPSLVFFPYPLPHTFHNAPVAKSDFTCAAIDVEGGQTHPILQALPPALMVPLEDVPSMTPVLELLFSEVDDPPVWASRRG